MVFIVYFFYFFCGGGVGYCTSVSETFVIVDALFKDTATQHYTKWWATNTLKVDTLSDGILLTNESTSGYVGHYCYLIDNFPSGWTDRYNAVKCLDTPFCIEFDLISCSSLSDCGLLIGDDSNNINTFFTNMNLTTGHIKVVVDGTNIRLYLNNATSPSIEFSRTISISRFGFRVNSNHNLKYNNFVVYPI